MYSVYMYIQAKIAHMKQCAKKKGISTTQLLELVRSPQSGLPSDDSASSQRKLEALLSKKHVDIVDIGGAVLKLGDLQHTVKQDDDDFKEPLPRALPKLGRKRKKEDFEET